MESKGDCLPRPHTHACSGPEPVDSKRNGTRQREDIHATPGHDTTLDELQHRRGEAVLETGGGVKLERDFAIDAGYLAQSN